MKFEKHRKEMMKIWIKKKNENFDKTVLAAFWQKIFSTPFLCADLRIRKASINWNCNVIKYPMFSKKKKERKKSIISMF